MRTLTKLLVLVRASRQRWPRRAPTSPAPAPRSRIPIYSKWFADYAAQTNVKINYQAIGSGGGIRQLSDGTVDFGASDSPMTDGELQKAKGGRVLHFPTVIGAVAVVYNVPGITDATQPRWRHVVRHLPRQGAEVERREDREAQSRRLASGARHSRRSPVRRQRHDLHLHGFPVVGEQGMARRVPVDRRKSPGRSDSAARATTASPVR